METVYREFKTAKGTVELLAEVVAEGKTLHLKDIAIFPRGARKLVIGTKEILEVRRELAKEAKSAGFEKLRVSGTRVSGANPGRRVDKTFDL